jgi:hypothetical protein
MFKRLFNKYTISDFARDIMDEYRKQGYQGTMNWNEVDKQITFETGGLLNLYNIYLEQKSRSSQQRQEFILHYVTEALAALNVSPNHWDDVCHAILPRVKTRAELASRHLYMRSVGAPEGIDPENDSWPIGADLCIELVIDGETSIKTVAVSDIEKMGVNIEEAKAKAMANLWSMSDASFDSVQPGLWRSPWQDNYDACRILLTD